MPCVILHLSFDVDPVKNFFCWENILCILCSWDLATQLSCLSTSTFFFCIFLPKLASKGVKMIKYNLLTCIIFVVVRFGNYFFFFIVRAHLCSLEVCIRGKHVILVLDVVYKQLKCISHSWISVWLTARLLGWSHWHNQSPRLAGGGEAAGARKACIGRLLLDSAIWLTSCLQQNKIPRLISPFSFF